MTDIVTIKLQADESGFTDDKDAAKKIRLNELLPALKADKQVVLDFTEVKSSTQSFVHALLGESLRQYRDIALERIEFHKCTPLMKSLVGLVVDYSLGGFRDVEAKEAVPPPKHRRRKRLRRD